MERHVRCSYREVTATRSLEFGHFSTKSHQRSWWIVHTQPTRTGTRSFPNPTNAVGGSFILSLDGRERAAPPNPTNAVGGSFILSLDGRERVGPPNPTNEVGGPPTQLG